MSLEKAFKELRTPEAADELLPEHTPEPTEDAARVDAVVEAAIGETPSVNDERGADLISEAEYGGTPLGSSVVAGPVVGPAEEDDPKHWRRVVQDALDEIEKVSDERAAIHPQWCRAVLPDPKRPEEVADPETRDRLAPVLRRCDERIVLLRGRVDAALTREQDAFQRLAEQAHDQHRRSIDDLLTRREAAAVRVDTAIDEFNRARAELATTSRALNLGVPTHRRDTSFEETSVAGFSRVEGAIRERLRHGGSAWAAPKRPGYSPEAPRVAALVSGFNAVVVRWFEPGEGGE
jgi:hypothetical protein